jgi:hypothetical protein
MSAWANLMSFWPIWLSCKHNALSF